MTKADLVAELTSCWSGPASTHGGKPYEKMIEALREFLDRIAGVNPDEQSLLSLSADLRRWADKLAAFEVDEEAQAYARRLDLVGRGQATWPPVIFTRLENDLIEGLVTFGRFYLGRNSVVHGGAIMLIFDEVAGRLANIGGRSLARTAYIRADFRAVAPINVELAISARYVKEEKRKRFIRIELRHNETLCAEAEVLMVALRPGQR